MSVMSAEARAEYLKRYLDSPKDKKKKKKKTVLPVDKEISDVSLAQRVIKREEISHGDSDVSPPRRREHDDSDISPPRKHGDSDVSPPRRREHDDSDISPPRRHRCDDSDISSFRRHDSDTSPPRKRGRDFIASPLRRRRAYNYSSPQSIKNEPASEPEHDEGQFAAPRRRVTLFNRRKRNGKEPEDPERKARELAKQEEWEKKYEKWSKGIQQTKEREAKLQELSDVARESFTRYADDETMNTYLKEQIYDDIDPMAKYYRTKQEKIEMKTGTVYPKYKGHWPPNRFGIAPGYRWDGVDRSNGFEARIASTENRRKAENAMAYRSMAECED